MGEAGSKASLSDKPVELGQGGMPRAGGGDSQSAAGIRRVCRRGALRLRPWVPPHCPLSPQTDIVKAIARLTEFYKHESCGQCTPCREGKRAGQAGGFLGGSRRAWAGHWTLNKQLLPPSLLCLL